MFSEINTLLPYIVRPQNFLSGSISHISPSASDKLTYSYGQTILLFWWGEKKNGL